MSENQIDHDRLFKELLETFFAEFIELFFPEAARTIDLEHLKFLQQECAADGKAPWVVSGDKHLLRLGSYKDITIVTAEQYDKIQPSQVIGRRIIPV